MCEEKDRCTYKTHAPPEPIGFWALAASSRLVRNESQEYFLRNTVVSIHPQDVEPWLDHLAAKKSQELESLRRITITAPNCKDFYTLSGPLIPWNQILRHRVPNLEGLGIQCQSGIHPWIRPCSWNHDAFLVDRKAWRIWPVMDMLSVFGSTVTIAVEAMMWLDIDVHWDPNNVEQQIAFRLIRGGLDAAYRGASFSAVGWTDEDVKVEIVQPGNLVSWRRSAGWRQWWRTEIREGIAYPSWT